MGKALVREAPRGGPKARVVSHSVNPGPIDLHEQIVGDMEHPGAIRSMRTCGRACAAPFFDEVLNVCNELAALDLEIPNAVERAQKAEICAGNAARRHASQVRGYRNHQAAA